MLGHMKSIKMAGLSQTLFRKITNLRVDEINAAKRTRIISAVSSSLSQLPQMISPVAAFALFTTVSLRSGETLDVTRMFTSLSLIMLLSSPLFNIIQVMIHLNGSLACFARIEKFLAMDARKDVRSLRDAWHRSDDSEGSIVKDQGDFISETPELQAQQLATPEDFGLPVIDVRKGCFSWTADASPVLRGVDFIVQRGELALVVGKVASGKSTLLKGLLGEVPAATGNIKVSASRIAWCEQSPWLTVSTSDTK